MRENTRNSWIKSARGAVNIFARRTRPVICIPPRGHGDQSRFRSDRSRRTARPKKKRKSSSKLARNKMHVKPGSSVPRELTDNNRRLCRSQVRSGEERGTLRRVSRLTRWLSFVNRHYCYGHVTSRGYQLDVFFRTLQTRVAMKSCRDHGRLL
ncbi:hypothetical protein WN55_03323 [Dufourea novaeangliae]|uniref:Uncharacterized protein n=1 Tax=Dufourea novaeangliae TaxID=178035 RepID=A0A154PMY2_DUFNO|nr:hypothetical protein WN55_03323 [Dufourea novaeangliae]